MTELAAGRVHTRFVTTPTHDVAAVLIGQTDTRRGRFVVSSTIPGVGKSRSVHQTATGIDRPLVWIAASQRATAATLNAEILGAAGADLPRGLPLWESTADAVALLTDLDPFVVIDDAHRLSADGLQHLQVLHERATFTLGIIGSAALVRQDRWVPELFDRADRWVEMTPLSPHDSIRAAQAAHRLFAATTPEVLRSVDAHYIRGRWRRWAQFLDAALDYTDQGASSLTTTRVSHILTALGWHLRPDPTRLDQ